MNRPWKEIIAALLIGLFLGAAGGWWGHRWRMQRWHGEGRDTQLLEKFTSQLDLTTEQKAQIASILEANRRKVDSLRSEVHPRFDEIRSSADSEIAKLLTPEQQVEFEKMKAHREGRRKRRHPPDE
ncbi:MAG: hypothetical protein HYY13_07540 [Nitrospirae bacterium]|nr:hypothetical protein [Nitrospirota bacterium]